LIESFNAKRPNEAGIPTIWQDPHLRLCKSGTWKSSRLEKNSRKEGHIIGNGILYPSIIINVHPSQFTATGLGMPAIKTDADPKFLSSLDIAGPRDKAVEYSEWQVSNVTDDMLKAAFR
jgi:hypothetical protein